MEVSKFMQSDCYGDMCNATRTWRTLGLDQQKSVAESLVAYLDSSKPVWINNPSDMEVRQRIRDDKPRASPRDFRGVRLSEDVYREDGRAAFGIGRLLKIEGWELHDAVVGEDLKKVISDIRATAARFVSFSVTDEYQRLIAADSPSALVDLGEEWKQRSLPAKRLLIQELLSNLRCTQPAGLAKPESVSAKTSVSSQSTDIVSNQDVLIVGGRCAWAIEQIMNEPLPRVHAGLEKSELDSVVEISTKQFERCWKLDPSSV